MNPHTSHSVYQALETIHRNIHHMTAEPKAFGRVRSVIGTVVQATGLDASLGQLHRIHTDMSVIEAEVVGIKDGRTLLMPLDRLDGIKSGCLVEAVSGSAHIKVGLNLLGRIIDCNGTPLDSLGPISGCVDAPIHRPAPNPMERKRIDRVMRTGVRAIDTTLTLGLGQRMGIFAGSGVGKSTLLGMIARNSSADINVISLIGERGREVLEFIHDILGEEGLKRSVVIVSTSDKSAMSRLKAAYASTAIAEHFRDEGMDVLLLMDSVTRVAMAQREVGLASGEPPTSKGYTPSVFTVLPKLLERAGTFGRGSITGLYTVLVENDDMNEPVADTVRSILDGHIVLSRQLAHRNHYPAIDVLASVSRLMDHLVSKDQLKLSKKLRQIMAEYKKGEDLIQIGAYAKGSNPLLDEAIAKIGSIHAFLQQGGPDPDSEDMWENLEHLLYKGS